MKRSVDRKELPVSRKAYNRFRSRIHEVLGQDSEAEARMVTALIFTLPATEGMHPGFQLWRRWHFRF